MAAHDLDPPTAPHCDPVILHQPGECEYYDHYPEWQQAREIWGINFTGQDDYKKLPCPAEARRDLGTINRWFHNQRKPKV